MSGKKKNQIKTHVAPKSGTRPGLSVIVPNGIDLPESFVEFKSRYQDKIEWISIESTLSEALKVSKFPMLMLPDASDFKNDETTVHWLEKFLKTNVNEEAIILPQYSILKKAGFGDKIKYYLSGVFQRLFSGSETHHTRWSLGVFPKAKVQELTAEYPCFEQLSGLSLVRELYRRNVLTEEIDCPEIQKNQSKNNLGTWCSMLWKEFVKVPLKSFSSPAKVFKDAHHPFYRFKFFGVAIIGLVLMLGIFKDYNVTWDEPTNQSYATHIYNYLITFGSDTTMFNFALRDHYTNQHYGMSFDVMAVAVQNFFPETNPYVIRHLMNALVGFLIVLFTGLLAFRLGGSRAGLLALLIMFFSPSFFGHFFNNPKDIPFALGFIMGIYYLSRVILEWPRPRLQSRVMLAVGIGYCLSIRAGGLLLFAFVVMFLGFIWLMQYKKDKSIVPFLRYGLPVLIIGYILGIILWPYALRDPIGGVLKALKEFENFGHLTYHELFEGVRLYLKPWYYIPKYILITSPLVLLAGALLSLLILKEKPKGMKALVIGLLLFATIFPWAYTVYKGSYLYNGWRHMLFIFPTFVVLGALGWNSLMNLTRKVSLNVVITAFFVGLTVPAAIWSFKNHPYQYMYFNELTGGAKGAHGEYEMDYWNQTPREAMEWIVKNLPEVAEGKVNMSANTPIETLTTFVPGSDSIKYRWTREYEWTEADWKYAIWTSRTLSRNQIKGDYWPPVKTLYTVDVDGVPVAAVVERVSMTGYDGHRSLKERKYDSAVYYFTKAIEFEPLEEEYFRGLGLAYQSLNQLEKAEEILLQACDLRDGNYKALLALGQTNMNIAFQSGNGQEPNLEYLAKAESYFKESAIYKANNTSALYFLGHIGLIKKDNVGALAHFKDILKMDANAPYGYMGVGKAFMGLQLADSAIYYFSISAQLDQNNPEPFGELAKAYQMKGDNQSAQRMQQEYIKRTQQ